MTKILKLKTNPILLNLNITLFLSLSIIHHYSRFGFISLLFPFMIGLIIKNVVNNPKDSDPFGLATLFIILAVIVIIVALQILYLLYVLLYYPNYLTLGCLISSGLLLVQIVKILLN